jgi:hypothetical protein
MSMLARLEPAYEAPSGRSAARRKLRLEARGSTAVEPAAQVLMHDLSETGALIETTAELSTGEHLEVHIPEAGATRGTIVWNSGRFFGCQFAAPIPRAAVSAAMLRSPAAIAPTPQPDVAARSVDHVLEQPQLEPGEWSLPAKLRLLFALTLGSWAAIGLVVWAAL